VATFQLKLFDPEGAPGVAQNRGVIATTDEELAFT
jgi:hypothetical protein